MTDNCTPEYDRERLKDEESVRFFSQKMALKLSMARASGRHGWRDANIVSDEQLIAYLRDNLDRQQYIDVANYAMMLYFRDTDKATGIENDENRK